MATSYFLDLRVKNNTNFAPVVVTLPATGTEKDVQGLRPGTEYSVTLKVFQFYFVVCVDTTVASTGKEEDSLNNIYPRNVVVIGIIVILVWAA